MIELLLAAEHLIAAGDLDDAERLFRQVAEADPRNAIAVVGLARIARARGHDDAAADLAHRALGIDPDEAAARRLLAELAATPAVAGPAATPAVAGPAATPAVAGPAPERAGPAPERAGPAATPAVAGPAPERAGPAPERAGPAATPAVAGRAAEPALPQAPATAGRWSLLGWIRALLGRGD